VHASNRQEHTLKAISCCCWSLLLLALTGCTWQTTHSAHVFGPVLFRYTVPPAGKAYLSQTKRFPLSLEGGQQWAASVGLSERLAIAPGPAAESAAPVETLSKPSGLFCSPKPGQWCLSLFYVRSELKRPPEFIKRSICGVGARAGCEETGLTAGYSCETQLKPRQEAFYFLQYDADYPLATDFKVWADQPRLTDLTANHRKEQP